ncbi:class I SAM-dependent methyltransferase [Reyranella sp. CPCC 100927]|uniref:class I SAM-dependent methyltransferase n=1 Tax=Reyranella sp. CPCC 100927 TaxID=2599616 RepID=UPI0011B3CEAD|nr:class I SAM-dependent methyltransferase [Reyranella sp. CPCC 100927]TWS98291.1 methyltransferase domain-containing protein [Reyranella sp. CPCC 100927]
MTSADTPTLSPEVAPALARTAAQYDEVPYQSHPFPLTHPARLAAIAALFGLSPPEVRTARILEIGCAAGGNIIPMAMHLPDSTCLGIDLSGVQIEQAQRRADGLDLRNLTLRRQSVTEIGPDDGPFDYIICHGVYSWVPATVREAILRVCAERLSDDGVAIVSYNVMPGWHMKRVVRDSMIAHAAHIPDPSQKIAQARWFIEFLKDRVPQQTPYGNALRTEAGFLANQRDDYVLHEFLEDENNPCTVTEFVLGAEKLGLGYLGETELHTMIAETYGQEIAVALRQLSDNRLLPLEQYIDILTGRTFRQSVLAKAATAARAQRALDTHRLQQLHVAGRFTPDSATGKNGARVFRDSSGRTLTSDSPGVAVAVEMLSARYPATATPAELAATAGRWAASPAAQEAAVIDALYRMLNAGMLDYYIEPVRTGSASAARPQATALARYDAAQRVTWTANLRHEPAAIAPAGHLLLPLMDGTRDRDALCTGLLQALADSGTNLQRDGQPISGDDERRRAALELIETTLQTLEKTALLEPDAG